MKCDSLPLSLTQRALRFLCLPELGNVSNSGRKTFCFYVQHAGVQVATASISARASFDMLCVILDNAQNGEFEVEQMLRWEC